MKKEGKISVKMFRIEGDVTPLVIVDYCDKAAQELKRGEVLTLRSFFSGVSYILPLLQGLQKRIIWIQ
jgi:hypothetical protein